MEKLARIGPGELIVTREMVLKAAGFEPVRDTRAAIVVVRAALEAQTDDVPDHGTRLKAAGLMLGLADVLQPGRPGINANITGPVSITWVTPTPLPSSPPKLTSGPSTSDSPDSRSSSATEDSAKPSWL